MFFLITWFFVILANQIFIFGACFAGYCLLAALPHTFVIAALITYFYLSDGDKRKQRKDAEYEAQQRNIALKHGVKEERAIKKPIESRYDSFHPVDILRNA